MSTHNDDQDAGTAGARGGEVIRFPSGPAQPAGSASGIEQADRDLIEADRIDPDRADSGHSDRARSGGAAIDPSDREVLEGEIVRVDDPTVADRGEWLAGLAERAKDRRPIVPPWLRSRQAAVATARWVLAHFAYVAGYHVSRLPKYAAKLAGRAPRGLLRLAGRLTGWVFDTEGLPVRLLTVQRADPEAYLKLSRQRDARVRIRVWVGGLAVLGTAGFGLWLTYAASGLTRAAVCAALVGVFGHIGRPADRPLIDRAVVPTRVERLTSDVVIRALGALGIAEINKALGRGGTGIAFTAPISRDGGTGWRADVDLPFGVTVTDIVDKRDRLASGLRRPLGCVWPEPARGLHPGRMVLFVADADMNAARQPAWPLARSGQADVFARIPFGTDQRGRLVTLTMMFASLLIGAMPRIGKTFSVKPLLLAAGLDPLVKALVFELKGTGDLAFAEKFAHEYAFGLDDDTIGRCLFALRQVKDDLIRRSKTIAGLPKDLCPENKVTPALAGKKSLGLEPVGIFIDECQNLFSHPAHGEEAGELCEFIIRIGPAMGVFLVLATQRPDKRSLPTGISANVGIRFCLRVMGQTENDMILGTSSYQNGVRATTFSTDDKGIGYLVGAAVDPQIVKTFYLDGPAAEKIADRARAVRVAAGRLTGIAAGQAPDRDSRPGHDLLADVAAVLAEPKAWNESIVGRLAELRPAAYGPWAELEPDARAAHLTAALKPYGVRTGQVWGTTGDGKGANRRGITRDDITAAITERNRKAGPDGAA